MFQKKRLLAGALALATCANLVTVGAFAGGESRSTSTQTSSAEETVYVNTYGGTGRQVDFSNHWRFNLGSGSEAVDYNDSAWRDVDLPHDYSIEQEYSANNEAESGYLPGGTGWYRKTFTLDQSWQDKVIAVNFGGVYMNATVYLNGQELGFHPYGYTAFSFELPQDLLKYDGENVLAVKVEHQTPSSRWYSGSGIYRSVNLTVTDPVHVAQNGTHVTTPDLATNQANPQVKVVTTVANETQEQATVSVKQTIYKGGSDAAVATIDGQEVTVAAGATQDVEQTTTVASPALWSTDSPNLYTVKTEILRDDQVVDTYTTEFGFRWTEFNNTNGFELNGVPTKLKGVCMHHDQGALGSEAWYRAVERQVEILKEMGVNAIRVTHNPAAAELIEIANRKGMMIIDEAFDTWTLPKNGNSQDYSKWFNVQIAEGNQILGGEAGMTWAEFDIKAMAYQDRNAPAVIMYSLGNEIFEGVSGNYNNYPTIAQNLIGWVKEVDDTRPPTFGDNKLKENWAIANQVAQVVADNGGVIGYNYSTEGSLSTGMNKGWNVYHSETASAVNSRGVYDRKSNASDVGGDRLLTAYDKSKVGWGALASDAWWRVLQQDGSAGEFVWTGFDYIGEPTPWNNTGSGATGGWPSPKSSYFGIIDTNGLPKDSYYLYQSQWNDDVTTLHLLPTWDEDDVLVENGNVEVVVYSDAPVVKLYKDGVEIGSATSTETTTGAGYKYRTYTSGTGCFQSASGHQSLYATFSVPYDGDKLEVKAFQADGTTEITETEGRSVVEKTTGAAKLTLSADRTTIVADGDDLSYITIDVQDAQGNLVNTDDVNVKLSIEGNGTIVGVDNGRQIDHTSYQSLSRNVGAGQLVAIVQSTDKAGSFTVTATANGLTAGSVTVNTTAVESGEDNSIVSYDISRYHYVKVGNEPQLPETVVANYKDGSTKELAVTWKDYDHALIEKVGSFTISGTLSEGNITVTVNITMLDQVAALLNYSTAVRVGGQVNLPASRPAVLADGTILNAEFPVTWDIPADLTATASEQPKKVMGTSQVFGVDMEVTAWVRVAEGDVSIGDNVAANVAEITQSVPQGSQSDSVQALTDGSTQFVQGPSGGPNPNVWSNYDWSQAAEANDDSYLNFRYDTAQNLGQVELYFFVDTWATALPEQVSLQWNLGSDENGWQDIAAQPSEAELVHDGTAKVYKITFNFDPVPAVQLRVKMTNKAGGPQGTDRQYCVGLTEVKFNLAVESFPINGSDALTGITVNGKAWSASELSARTYSTEALVVDTLEVQNGNNVAYTQLAPYNNVVKILTESEDHATRGTYTIQLGSTPSAGDPADGSRDYDYTKTAATAASAQGQSGNEGPVKFAVDNNRATFWHSAWGEDLRNQPEKRWIQLELEEATLLDALRYQPRNSIANGIVTQYRVEVSSTGQDGSWTTVSEGTWAHDTNWKIAQFDHAVEAKYVRLYGVETRGGAGDQPNQFMSCAELRVRVAEQKTDLSSATVTLDADVFEYTGSAIEPKPTVVLEGKTLKYGVDYAVDYQNNVAPGQATLTVRGIVDYSGTVTKTFTIEASADLEVKEVESVSVITSQGDKPTLPATVKVTFTDNSVLDCAVTWDTVTDEQVAQVGNVFTVNGTVALPNGKQTTTTASVRVITQNLALKQEGSTLPLAVSFYSPASDSAVNINDGSKTFDISASKKVWSDWEADTYHDAPWVAIILKEATTVDRVSIGFIDETGSSNQDVQADHSVRLPASYEIQVYVGTDALDYKTDNVNNGRNWPVMNNDANWKTVATVTQLPQAKDYAQMLESTFEGVKTTAVRVVMTPQNQQWVGVDELEIYGSGEEPLNSDFTVESITADGVNVLGQADENNHITLTVEEGDAMPVLAATATNNAKVEVIPAADFNDQARIVITSEDGSKIVTYTVSFQVTTQPTPSVAPTTEPTVPPTAEPSVEPTVPPTAEPTAQPTDKPQPSDPVVTDQPQPSAPVTGDVMLDNNSNVGISVGNADQVFDKGTVISVESIVSGQIYDTVKEALKNLVADMKNTAILDITANLNGQAVQPSGKVQMTFQIPQNLSVDNLKLFYVSEDGKSQEIPITVDKTARTATANLEHFSTYVLANVVAQSGNVPSTGDASQMLLYVVVLAASVSLLCGAVVVSKRRAK